MLKKASIFWFRRDLRLEDNIGLYHALKGENPVIPIFIFDKEIIENLPKTDARISFIHQQVHKLKTQLQNLAQSSIGVYYGSPISVFKMLLKEFDIINVFTNHDYEPYATKRDIEAANFLAEKNIGFKSYKDQVIFEKNEITKNDGKPYVVYTPFKNRWKENFNPSIHLLEYQPNLSNFLKKSDLPFLSLRDIGFKKSTIKVSNYTVTKDLVQNYEATRNFPAIDNGTSKLGPHLRFGTVSIRKMLKKAIAEENEIFWNELIWREFFMQILWHFPHTHKNAFKPKYDRIKWRNNPLEFDKWKKGETGYALVDAGMRELNATGYMHNRVRMLVASFLCKHLLIDWRWGEAYFAEKLLDYDMSANVGNWQWAAGSGVDAAPYFRIFNPMTQIEKFDKQKEYISKWVTDLQEFSYPPKIVNHKMARERCLSTYKQAVG